MKGEAAGEFEAALRIEPGMAEAHGNLGLILVGVPGRFAEGVAHLEAALKGNEENPEFADLHLDLAEALARIPERLPSPLRSTRRRSGSGRPRWRS